MLKNIIQLTAQVDEKLYHLLCDNDSLIEHVKEALFQLTKMVAEIEEKIKESQKKKTVNESATEPEEA
jgi:predicted nucleic acid-binding protein